MKRPIMVSLLCFYIVIFALYISADAVVNMFTQENFFGPIGLIFLLPLFTLSFFLIFSSIKITKGVQAAKTAGIIFWLAIAGFKVIQFISELSAIISDHNYRIRTGIYGGSESPVPLIYIGVQATAFLFIALYFIYSKKAKLFLDK